MGKSNYMKNRQKLLFMVLELHKKGYENLRVVPSLSPSGLSWRCIFVTRAGATFIASNWLAQYEASVKSIRLGPKKLAEIFVRENDDFLVHCKGSNSEYVEWYRAMAESLNVGELPFAFSDYFSPDGFWRTSEERRIKTLPGDKDYYFNY